MGRRAIARAWLLTEPTLTGAAVRLLVVILLVAANALFVAAEFALVSLEPARSMR